jgi:hypothetical protein
MEAGEQAGRVGGHGLSHTPFAQRHQVNARRPEPMPSSALRYSSGTHPAIRAQPSVCERHSYDLIA